MISAFSPDEACNINLPGGQNRLYRHWTAEVYGLGRAYRVLFGLPPDAYLPFTSDHGVTDCKMGFEAHEIKSGLHLTFQGHRYALFSRHRRRGQVALFGRRRRTPKSVIHVEHPYINYWKLNPPRGLSSRSGVLVFFPHSLPEDPGYAVNDIEEFLAGLRDIPKQLGPVSLMLHYHDVRRGALEMLEGSGFRLLSSGHPMHPDFIDRLGEAFAHHQYVASSVIGTEAFLCDALGTEFLLLPDANRNLEDLHHGIEFAERQSAEIERVRSDHMSLGVRPADYDLRLLRAALRGERVMRSDFAIGKEDLAP